MSAVAIDSIILGGALVAPGEDVPAVWTDGFGVEHETDVERLVELGVAERRSSGKRSARRSEE